MNKDKVNAWVNPNAPEYFKNFMQELVSDMKRVEQDPDGVGAAFASGVFDKQPFTGGRSEQGMGEQVHLTVMGPAEVFEDGQAIITGGIDHHMTRGEDYARCGWPVVVKVKLGTDKRFVVRALREYANSIESSEYDEFSPADLDPHMRDLPQPPF